ncbi:hypothetical protein PFISCL1PPCAC_5529, partial [Pristionchus fissidentatus]
NNSVMNPDASRLANLLEIFPKGTGELIRLTASREPPCVKEALESMADISDAVAFEDPHLLSDSLTRAFDGFSRNSTELLANTQTASSFYLAATVASYVDKMQGMMRFNAANAVAAATDDAADVDATDRPLKIKREVIDDEGDNMEQDAADEVAPHRKSTRRSRVTIKKEMEEEEDLMEEGEKEDQETETVDLDEFMSEVIREEEVETMSNASGATKRTVERTDDSPIAVKRTRRQTLECPEGACDYVADGEAMAAHLETFHADGVLHEMERDRAFEIHDKATCSFCPFPVANIVELKNHIRLCTDRMENVSIFRCRSHSINFTSLFYFFEHAKETNCRDGISINYH